MILEKKIYLDSCILIAYFHQKHKNHKIVCSALKVLESFDSIKLYTSQWALNEMRKVLVKELHYSETKVEGIVKKLIQESKIGNIKINWIEMHTDGEYDFKDFFEHLTRLWVNTKDMHLADAIHSVIMANNKIDYIFTTNGTDFMGLKTFTVLEPKQIITFESH